MALTSASTFEQVQAEYRDTASYSLTADVALAKRFVVACRFMLDPTFLQDEHRHAGESSRISFDRVREELERAEAFIANGGDIQTSDEGVYVSFAEFRS